MAYPVTLAPDAWAQIRYDYEHTGRPVEDICAAHGISSGTLRDRMRRWGWRRRRLPIPSEGPPALAVPLIEFSPPPIRAANSGEGPGVGAEAGSTAPPTPLRLADASRSDPPRHFVGGGKEEAEPSPHIVEDGRERPFVVEDRRERPFVVEDWRERPFVVEDRHERPFAGDTRPIGERLQAAAAGVLPAIEAAIARLAAGPHHPREMEQTGRALGTLTRTLRELNVLLSKHQVQAEHSDDMPEDIDAFRIELARRIEVFVASRTGDNETPNDTSLVEL